MPVKVMTRIMIMMLWLASCSALSVSTADTTVANVANVVRIEVKSFAFSAATVTIETGQTIVWVNRDDEPHNIVADDHSFRSPLLDSAEQFSQRFTHPGEFRYHCSLHPHMTGKVIVVEHLATQPS